MSRYLNPLEALNRLRNEWAKYGSIIVAFDVDSTVLPFHQSEYKDDYEPIRQLLRDLKLLGCTLIAFTAAEEGRWDKIKEQLDTIKVPYDYFNESPETIPHIVKMGKVYANAYLDDRGGMYELFMMLTILVLEEKARRFEEAAKTAMKLAKSY